MDSNRTAANWQAICEDRDLLKEIEHLHETGKAAIESKLRECIAEQARRVILNPEYSQPPKGDH